MPDPVFEYLYRDTEQVRWAPTSEVQHRGRQLTRQRMLTVLAAALVLLVGGGVGALNALANSGPPKLPDVVATNPVTPTPSPTRATTTPPSVGTPSTPPTNASPDGNGRSTEGEEPTGDAIPLAAMLQVSDLPSGYRPYPYESDEGGNGHWHVQFLSMICGNKWKSGGGVERVGDRERHFRNAGNEGIQQQVSRYPQTSSTRYIPRLRTDLEGCRDFEVAIGDQGFAGDESMVVIRPDNSGWIIVRKGDLVAEIGVRDVSKPAEVRRLADAAVDRLCNGTDRC
ncbi:hypothetical protein [Plantactinospora soyae]|uniref:Uncharacterized protein n=1 Tax=Plantactinospora soyae TaxID=1544732 RepID=A0A927QWV0_9ACTN|nr:hypothetical protein [Plantactinospora soyae]MBE1485987.1 hypothetical protein [Plantactinospora soyae]